MTKKYYVDDINGKMCPYCHEAAEMVKGTEVYPRRPELAKLNFWRCKPCRAYVGCHKPNKKMKFDGTEPLGRLADPQLRHLRHRAHEWFDPLWRDQSEKIFSKRESAYAFLSDKMALHKDDTHIGMFDGAQCEQVMALAKQLRGTIG